MLILAKALLALMTSFIIAVVFGLIAIPLLKKLKAKQTISVFLSKLHNEKKGVPTIGGIIFIIPTIVSIILLILFKKLEFSHNLFIILFVFVGYAILGFIDDYLIIKRGNNEGLTQIQKLFGQTIIALVFFIIYMKSGREPILDIHSLGITINMGWFYGLFILFILVASSNAVNITDGLDGLAGGLSVISFFSIGIISLGSTWIAGSEEIGIFCFILVGALLGFLIYNSHPAKVIMGDTGSLSLGATLAAVTIITNHELSLIAVAGIFIIETLSVILQVISVKTFHKRIFLMTPLHHHFEKIGWSETDIVRMFYVFGMLLGMGAVIYGVWI
jgi:phospho-N-acetylmuramoyl-pentapeptide-transferase